MPKSLLVSEYVDHLDKEYLSTFVRNGGATIKFVVPDDGVKTALKQSMETRAKALRYHIVNIDSATCRVHMPQDLFFELARQVDWRVIIRNFLLGLAEKFAYRIDGINAEDDNVIESIANAEHSTHKEVIRHLRPKLESISKNTSMADDFRKAMTALCKAEMDSDSQDYGGQCIVDWLTGLNQKVSSVRDYGIYTPINRTTARSFLESALYWFRHIGISGTLIMLDNARLTVSKRPRPKDPTDTSRYYTRSTTIEAYEVLRQFIDSAERLTSTIVLAISNDHFLDTEHKFRGMVIYEALQTRIMEDVRDKNLVNPNAPLIRLRGESKGVMP